MGLADNDLSHVAFLVLFDVDNEDVDLEGGELSGVVMCLLKNNIN